MLRTIGVCNFYSTALAAMLEPPGSGRSYNMSDVNLQQRLLYFESRLEEAMRRSAAKEPHPRKFDAGYTTETFKTWAESISLIKERINGIRAQMETR
jgi:hypothetical protein